MLQIGSKNRLLRRKAKWSLVHNVSTNTNGLKSTERTRFKKKRHLDYQELKYTDDAT